MRIILNPLGAHDANRPPQRGSGQPEVRRPAGSIRGPRPHGGPSTWAWPGRLALLGLALVPSLVQAQVLQTPPDPVGQVVVTAPAKAGLGACPAADYACLDKALKAAAANARPAEPVVLGDAVQADVPARVGTFSQAATAQRLGPNFGHAATPWRPTTAAATNAILAGRPTR